MCVGVCMWMWVCGCGCVGVGVWVHVCGCVHACVLQPTTFWQWYPIEQLDLTLFLPDLTAYTVHMSLL